MKKNVLVLVLGAIMLTGFTSCNMGNGNVISQERTAEGFNGVSLNGVGNVNIYPGESFKVIVITDSNLQDRVETTVNGSSLIISQKNSGFSTTELTINVYLPELKSISLHGAGNININAGNTSELDISLSGTGEIDAQNFQVQNIAIEHSGAGTAKIWATNTLNGNLKGAGKILYKGSPTMNVNISGIGKVSQI